MIYLVLSIISATCLVLIFKLFEKFKIDTFQAIVINYIAAASVGFFLDDSSISIRAIPYQSWFFNAVIIGILFISMFNIVAITTQKIGIAVASVASKMSLIIPVVFAVYLYGDAMPLSKIAGILLAMAGVYLTFRTGKNKGGTLPPMAKNSKLVILPVIVFIGSGLLDTLFKYTEHEYLADNDLNMFISSLFSIAAIAGIIVIIPLMLRSKIHIQAKNTTPLGWSPVRVIIGGIVLGIPNYGSVFFLLKTLEIENLESSLIFPVNNMGIVGLSAIAAFLFFKEKLTMMNWAGIALSIIAIAMIAL